MVSSHIIPTIILIIVIQRYRKDYKDRSLWCIRNYTLLLLHRFYILLNFTAWRCLS